jgi:nicotinate dehydrogenase subunit A
VATPLTRTLNLNGENRTVSVDDESEPLLYVLRNQLGQLGPKFGCGVAQCGACTVLVDGEITRSCVRAISAVPEGAAVTTLDGLGSPGEPHPMQAAFIDEQAGQCSYCVNGVLMGAYAWLQQRTSVPTETEIAAFLSGEEQGGAVRPRNYLCRCGAHTRMVRAIRLAAEEMLS